jgi:hypothetical protein
MPEHYAIESIVVCKFGQYVEAERLRVKPGGTVEIVGRACDAQHISRHGKFL